MLTVLVPNAGSAAAAAAAAALGVLRGDVVKPPPAVRVPRGEDLMGLGRMIGVSRLTVSNKDKPAENKHVTAGEAAAALMHICIMHEGTAGILA
jgi:hypothetical protein